MVRATIPATTAEAEAPPRRPPMVFRRGTVTVRAVPEGKGWRVEGDDPGLVARIAAALQVPIKAWVSREAIDEVSGAFQIESWVTELQPDDVRYPYRLALSLDQVHLDPQEFDDVEFERSGG